MINDDHRIIIIPIVTNIICIMAFIVLYMLIYLDKKRFDVIIRLFRQDAVEVKDLEYCF